MSSNPLPPNEPLNSEKLSLPRWVSILFVVAFALVGWLVYANFAQRQALRQAQVDASKKEQTLSAQLDKTNAKLAEVKGDMDVASQKLGLTEDALARARALAQTARKEERSNTARLRQQIGAVQADTATKIGQVSTQLSGTQSDLSATKADLEATKNSLKSTIGDLGVQSGLIARNHKEVQELQALGERNIYEFTLHTSKHMLWTSPSAWKHVGPIELRLRHVDSKHYRYTMNVLADDKNIEKKDRDVDEPVQFYVRGARAPYEIVVFKVEQNTAQGYLSTPKSATAPPPSAPNAKGSNAPPGL